MGSGVATAGDGCHGGRGWVIKEQFGSQTEGRSEQSWGQGVVGHPEMAPWRRMLELGECIGVHFRTPGA